MGFDVLRLESRSSCEQLIGAYRNEELTFKNRIAFIFRYLEYLARKPRTDVNFGRLDGS